MQKLSKKAVKTLKSSSLNQHYTLHEGREKQTLIEKYINLWTEREDSIETPPSLIEDIHVATSKQALAQGTEEYKKFLVEYRNNDPINNQTTKNTHDQLTNLSDLIQSRRGNKEII